MNPIDDLFAILEALGRKQYGETTVSQYEHAVQCAVLAERGGAGPTLVTAALLHDIGHLVERERYALIERGEDAQHEQAGARYLAQWFGADVTEPVRLHVPAKRYLTVADPSYAARLSPASTRSLRAQGGPFAPAEAEAFLATPYADQAVALRRWDEGAKVGGVAVPSLDQFRAHVAACLRQAAAV
ncbi:MAG TPA: HD domain-containing protein [Alphaproteobacteria bacterium]|jgi:phosphonate degradation associated HDIG domain protein|nr:HD domain-containing protein [Alphaproteobacteria bacterium]